MEPLLTTATSAEEAARGARIAVLPVGSCEQHADFLPLITDTVVASVVASRVAQEYDLFLLPPVTFSCSHEHSTFAGTVSISATTLVAVVTDIAASLRAAGIERLAVVNGHGGNYVLSNVVQEANAGRGPAMTLFPTREDWDAARAHACLTSSRGEDMHAGELEVSLLLHAAPELVGEQYRERDHDAPSRPHLLVTGMAGYTDTGVVGRPSLGTAAKGAAILDSLTESFKQHIALLG